jgi:hypothetical protein
MSQAGYPTYQSMSTGCSTHRVIHNVFVSMGKLVENYPRTKFGSICGIVLIKNWYRIRVNLNFAQTCL